MVEVKYDPIKYKTPTGTKLNCKGWIQEAALRMLLNNLNPEVAEKPDELIVYGGRGKAARNFESLDLIIKALKDLENPKNKGKVETAIKEASRAIETASKELRDRQLVFIRQLILRNYTTNDALKTDALVEKYLPSRPRK